LQQISEMRVGVLNKDSASICTAQSCSVWFNELHMKGPLTRRGTAFKVAGDFEVPNWMTLGGKWREVDRRFETLTTVVTNRDEEIQSGYMNFSRLRFLPMSFDLSRTETRTPDVSLTGLSNLVSILEEGKTVHWTGNARGTLSLPRKMPALGLGFSRDRNELNGLDRIDDKKSYSASTNYALPWQGRILPTNVGLRYGLSHNQIRFGDISGTNVARLISGNDNRLETTQEYEVRMNFAPWRGTTWNPSYSLIQVEEERTTLNADLSETIEEYDKSLSQTVGFNSRLQLTDWFIPNLNYSITTLENNLVNLSTTSVLRRGEIKNVTRNSSSEVSLATAFQQIWPGSKLLRTLNVSSSYRLEDGDLWENVENGLDSKTALWIRSPLDPKNPSARRLQQTLRDTLNLIFRWSPFQAYRFTRRLSPFQTLSLADTFTQSTERKDVTGSASKTITTNSPDLVATLNQVETLFFSESWMANSQANARFSQRETETIGAALREENNLGFDLRFLAWDRYSTNLTYNTRGSEDTDLRAGVRTQRTSAQDFSTQSTFDSGIWRLTPRLDYQTNESQDGTGRFTAKGTILTPSLIARADLSLPSGLRIPFLNRTLSLTNRFILNSTLKFERKRSPVAQTDNSDTASLDFSGDYEVAQNLRLTLAGGISRLWHKFLKQEDFLAYNFATTLTFQF
ncbi:MAG: hypothetical protein HY402_04640, partial [Elusimicrobia bacterium]|nr:hypothetical protein [Elusimicrobiota bacterium]